VKNALQADDLQSHFALQALRLAKSLYHGLTVNLTVKIWAHEAAENLPSHEVPC
jgi:hypothetical protein